MTFKFLGSHQFPERNDGVFRIGHLDAHRCLSGNRRFNSDIRDRKIQLDIICQGYNPADLHALIRLQLIACHRRALAYIRHCHTHAEIPENLLQMHGSFVKDTVRILCFPYALPG